MDQPAGLDPDDPPHDAVGDDKRESPPRRQAPKLAKRPLEVQSELDAWYQRDAGDQLAALDAEIAGHRQLRPEILVHECNQAVVTGNEKRFLKAYEALSRNATPLLLKRRWDWSPEERQEAAGDLLAELLGRIRAGQAEFAECAFAAYVKRRMIDRRRRQQSTFEGSSWQEEPSDDYDPVDNLPTRIPSPEARGLLLAKLSTLPPKVRSAFIQYHLLERTQDEIAALYEVDARTIRNWLKRANAAVGLGGEGK